MEIGITGTHRGWTIVVELIASVASTDIVQLCRAMLIAGIIVTTSMECTNRSRWRWWQWRACLLLLHARQQHTLPIGVVVDGIQWDVFAITVIVVTVLAQTAQLRAGHIVAVVHNVIVQRLQIGCSQRALLLLLLAMK